ncbi:MAG: hypothetical protein E7650_06540 [Ruminococcaceae bacterium]|nr:hypothetical protein [Oscillospiraceae bacterium]
MMNTSLALSLGERLGYAGRMTLIGMMTIFAALSLLWGALALFRTVLAAADKRRAAKTADAAAPVEAAAPAPTPVTDDGAVVAAITAAISLMLAEENGGSTPAFRVVSFKRSGKKL